jgi:hypothetical protein
MEPSMRKEHFIIVLTLLGITACVPSTYTVPTTPSTDQNTFIISKNYDDTWSSLIDFVTSSHYTIDNVDKSSGLITVYFGKENPGEYVDCGLFNNTSYAEYLTKEYNSALVGQMNITSKSLNENQTRIKVYASYKFTVADLQWKFVTGSSDSETLSGTSVAIGANSERTCQTSYKIDKEFHNAVQGV